MNKWKTNPRIYKHRLLDQRETIGPYLACVSEADYNLLQDEFNQFKAEWASRFGFHAQVNDRHSFESIDEVANIFYEKS